MDLPTVTISQSPEEKFREYLASRPRPQRFTEQQRELIQYIFSKHYHFDADQLMEDMKRDGFHKISRATTYRTLNKLVEAGLLRRLEVGPRTKYEHDYGYPQHDHLRCERCGTMIEFENAELESYIRQVCAQENFQLTGHNLLIRGICAQCNRARSVKRRLDLV